MFERQMREHQLGRGDGTLMWAALMHIAKTDVMTAVSLVEQAFNKSLSSVALPNSESVAVKGPANRLEHVLLSDFFRQLASG